jgi:F-type H+-transporting ATPase subunit epsilon
MNENLNQSIEQARDLRSTLQLDIVSIDKQYFSGRVKLVMASGAEGELGILPGHSQLLAALKPGLVRYITLQGQEESVQISGGFIEVQPEVVTVLADAVLYTEDLDEARALAAKATAEKILSPTSQTSLDEYATAFIELTRALAQLRLLQKKQKGR